MWIKLISIAILAFPKVLVIFSFVFLLFENKFISPGLYGKCSCEGIIVSGSDQEHCWQLETRSESTWASADEACQDKGGHLGHPESSNYSAIISYVQNNSDLPALTGIVAGNVEIPLYARMCQNNSFYDIISDDIFSNNATSNETCSFITSSTNELVFMSCSVDAVVLCDRPLEQTDYCSIMASCSSTTSMTSTTSTMTSTITSSAANYTSTTENSSTASLVTDLTSNATTLKTTVTIKSTDGVVQTTVAKDDTDTDSESEESTTKSTCENSESCLKNQFKLFGMCIDWRALLALLILFLLLFLCCSLCHFCLKACMWCTPRQKVRDNNSIIKDSNDMVNYKVDKTEDAILPPPAVIPEPVIITVPEKHESVYGFHTKEIVHIYPEKPQTRDFGVNTDPIPSEEHKPEFTPKKKKVKKPKKMFIPSTVEPIEEDAAEEIFLPFRLDTPSNESIAPLGDLPSESVPPAPLAFARNAKPVAPEPKTKTELPVIGEISIGEKGSPTEPTPTVNDPSRIRSPPIPKNNSDVPKEEIRFSPIPDESDDEPVINAIPSPPQSRKQNQVSPNPRSTPAPIDEGDLPPPIAKFNRQEVAKPPKKNSRMSDVVSNNNHPVANNPFAKLGPSPSNEEPNPTNVEIPGVGMKAARGRLGGAVKGGGGGGDAPTAWKPWSKANQK